MTLSRVFCAAFFMKEFISLTLVLPLLFSACASYQPKPLSPADAQTAFAGRSLNDSGLQNFLADHKKGSGAWSLDRLALAAVYFNADVALARAEAEEAAAAIKTAHQRPNPSLTLGPQFASNAVASTPWFIAQSISIPIETAGKRSLRTEQAEATARAAQWRVAARAWAVRSRVRLAMLELYGARENMRLIESEQKLHDEAMRKLTAQMDAGDVSPFELTQARLSLNRTRLAYQDTQRIAATSEARLAAAIGVPVVTLQSAPLDFSSFKHLPAAVAHASRRKALTQRADLMALLMDYEAAESSLRLEIARQYPDLRLSPGYDFNQGQNRWQLGLNMELPLNRNRGPIAQAEARRKTVEARFLAQQQTIQGELDAALAAYQASRSKVVTAESLAQEAATAAETTQRMVDAGELSPLESTRRRIEASTANLALMTATLEAQTAASALEDAMQTPLSR